MPADVELARREGVELVRTGSWSAASGSWNPTREDILSAVKATECPAVRRPRLKLGHFDPRFNDGNHDGEPALGWFENLRAADGGNTLVGDQVALPWLSQVQAAAYPDRSIEGTYRFRCGLSHEHPFVITAVALLGVTPPAVSALKSLADLPDMLGVAAAHTDPANGQHVQITVPARPDGVQAGAGNGPTLMSLAQKIRDAWNASGAPFTQWVQEVRANAAVVVDDADRTHRLIPVSFDGDRVLFGTPQPYDPESDRPVVFASRAESRPEAPADAAPSGTSEAPTETPPPADPPAPELPAAEPEPTNNEEDPVSLSDDMRSRLGLAEGADEVAALAAIDALKAAAEKTPEPTPEMVAASAAAVEQATKAEQEKDELRKEVTVLASQVKTMSDELSASKAAQAATVKASVFDAAVKDGKIKPADREQWEKDYDDAPGAVTRVLASLAVGTAVPVMASGVVGGAEPESPDDWDAIVARLDGPSAKAV